MAVVADFIIQLLIGTTLSDQKNKKTINLITFKSVINEALSHYLLYVVWNHGACSMTCVQVFLIKSDYSSYYTAAEVQHPFLKSCPILLSYSEYIAWPSPSSSLVDEIGCNIGGTLLHKVGLQYSSCVCCNIERDHIIHPLAK